MLPIIGIDSYYEEKKIKKVSKFEAIKTFELVKYDENGFSLEGESIIVEAGSYWYVDESGYNLVGGDGCVRLIKVSESNIARWIEIHEDTLEECFMKWLIA